MSPSVPGYGKYLHLIQGSLRRLRGAPALLFCAPPLSLALTLISKSGALDDWLGFCRPSRLAARFRVPQAKLKAMNGGVEGVQIVEGFAIVVPARPNGIENDTVDCGAETQRLTGEQVDGRLFQQASLHEFVERRRPALIYQAKLFCGQGGNGTMKVCTAPLKLDHKIGFLKA